MVSQQQQQQQQAEPPPQQQQQQQQEQHPLLETHMPTREQQQLLQHKSKRRTTTTSGIFTRLFHGLRATAICVAETVFRTTTTVHPTAVGTTATTCPAPDHHSHHHHHYYHNPRQEQNSSNDLATFRAESVLLSSSSSSSSQPELDSRTSTMTSGRTVHFKEDSQGKACVLIRGKYGNSSSGGDGCDGDGYSCCCPVKTERTHHHHQQHHPFRDSMRSLEERFKTSIHSLSTTNSDGIKRVRLVDIDDDDEYDEYDDNKDVKDYHHDSHVQKGVQFSEDGAAAGSSVFLMRPKKKATFSSSLHASIRKALLKAVRSLKKGLTHVVTLKLTSNDDIRRGAFPTAEGAFPSLRDHTHTQWKIE